MGIRWCRGSFDAQFFNRCRHSALNGFESRHFFSHENENERLLGFVCGPSREQRFFLKTPSLSHQPLDPVAVYRALEGALAHRDHSLAWNGFRQWRVHVAHHHGKCFHLSAFKEKAFDDFCGLEAFCPWKTVVTGLRQGAVICPECNAQSP